VTPEAGRTDELKVPVVMFEAFVVSTVAEVARPDTLATGTVPADKVPALVTVKFPL
jgi:hypothetical protein